MGFQVRDADNPSAAKTAAGTADRNTSGIGNALVAVLLGAAGMEITITEMLAILDIPDGLTAYERRALQGLPAYTTDMELVSVETWATATDAEITALNPNVAADQAQISLLAAGSVPSGASGWATEITPNANSVIVIRIPLAAHRENYRLQAVVSGSTSYERGQFIQERARNSQYKYISTLNDNIAGTFTLQHHGVDHHTRYHGELDPKRVDEAYPLHIAEIQFSPNQILETAVPGNIRAYVRMMPNTLPTATRVRMSINGVWSNTTAKADSFIVRTTLTPEQQTALQTRLDSGGHIPIVIQFLTADLPTGTEVYSWTSHMPFSEPFVFPAVSEAEARAGTGTALRSWSAGRVALTARGQMPVARVDMFPNYIVQPAYKGEYKLIIQEFRTEFLTGVTKIIIRVQGEAVHTENWTPRDIANTTRTIDFEITEAEAGDIINALTSGGNITHPETAICEISFVNASDEAVAQVHYSLINITADEVPGAAESHTVLSHQHTVNITTPDTNVWVATGYTLEAGKLVYLEADDPPGTGTTASAQSETFTGWFRSDALIAKTAQTAGTGRNNSQGQIILEDMHMYLARDSSNQLLLSRHSNDYDAVPLRIYHAEISTTEYADGKIVYGGDDRPANNIGKIGDTYLRRQSNGLGLYEKTAESTWTYRYAILLLPAYPTLNQRDKKIPQFPIAGMIKWLNSIRENPETTSAITGQGAAAFGHPTQHRYIIPESRTIDNDYYQLMVYFVASYIRNGHLIRLEILGVGIGENYSPYHLQNAIGVQAETLDTRVYVDRPFGVRNTPARMLKAVLSDKVELDALNGIPRIHVEDQGEYTKQIIPFGNHRVIDFDDLDPVVDETMTELYRLMPEPLEKPMVHEIHHYGANGAIRLINPEKANEYSGTSRPLVIDNQGTGRLEILDWDRKNVVTLAPNQDAKLRFVYDNFGGSRLLGQVTPRYIEASAGSVGAFVNTGYYNFDTNNWAKPVPVATPSYIDTDAFEIGTAANIVNASQWNVANVEGALSADTLKILKDGILEFQQSVTFTIVGTGSMTAGSLARVYLLRDDTLTVIDEADYGEITGEGTSRSFRWGFRRRVKADDVIIPMYVYPKGTTLNINECTINDFLRTVTLDQEIAIEYKSPDLP